MIKILFNTALGVALIFIWAHFVNLGQIIKILSKVNVPDLFLVLIFMFLSPLIRALRLKVFLSEVKEIPLKDLVFLNGLSLMLNFFIPIRAGEIAKGVYLNTKYGLHLGKSVIWIFLDRFVDFLAVLLISAGLLFIVPTSLNITFIKVIIIIFGLALSLTYLAIFKKDFSRKLINFLKPLLIEKHIKIYFERFTSFILESFSILNRHPKDLALIIIITVFAYAADGGIWYFTFISLGANQSFLKMYLGQLLSALSYLIPAAPGYVGSAEASGLLILSGIFGINPNLASAMTVLVHITSAVFILIFGLISVYSLKIDLGLVLKKALNRS